MDFFQRAEHHHRSRENYVDRWEGTIFDGFVGEGTVVQTVLKILSDQRLKSFQKLEMAALFTWMLVTCVRSDDVRMFELADLGFMNAEEDHEFFGQQGHNANQKTPTIVWLMLQGKKNQVKKPEVVGVVRNVDYRKCGISFLAMLLFFRWSVKREAFPDMNDPKIWHEVKIFRNDNTPYESMTYNDHNRMFKAIKEYCSIQSKKTTNIPRQQIKSVNVSDDQREEDLGRCNRTTMHFCYMVLNMAAVRAANGHPDVHGRPAYFNRRETVPAPESLLKTIWPELDFYASAPNQQSIGRNACIEALLFFRTVLLQDVAVWKFAMPDFFLLEHAPFNTREFADYAERVWSAEQSAAAVEPAERTIDSLVPQMADVNSQPPQGMMAHMRPDMTHVESSTTETIAKEVQEGFKGLKEQFAALSRGVLESHSSIQRDFKDFRSQVGLQRLSGFQHTVGSRFSDSQMEAGSSLIAQGAQLLVGGDQGSTNQQVNNNTNFVARLSSAQSNVVSASSDSVTVSLEMSQGVVTEGNPQPAQPRVISDHPMSGLAQLASYDPLQVQPQQAGNGEMCPGFIMRKDVDEIPMLWREWKVGLYGQPPLEHLEKKWGKGWRKKDAESRFFNRRRRIIKKIESMMAQDHVSGDAAAQTLEIERQRKGVSINTFQQQLEVE
jgi:hypothetical protein